MTGPRLSRRALLRSAAVTAGAVAASGPASIVGSAAGPPTAPETPGWPTPSKLRADQTDRGRYFVDDDGRVVVLRGVNVVDKTRRGPEFPPSEISEADIDRLSEWGFNFVRLGIQWAKLMPRPPAEPGPAVDRGYLDRIQAIVEKLGDHGVYVLLDMHQDLYSYAFTGDGAPAWAIYDEGFPFIASEPWWTRYLQPAVLSAFDNFWENTAELQEAFARAWQAVAERLGDRPNVVGYDLFNEPVPGYRTAITFEQRWLRRFTNRLITRIRAVDPETPIWVEPAIYFGGGIPSRLGGIDDPDSNLGFSFHAYPELVLDDLGWIHDTVNRYVDVGRLGYQWIMGNAASASWHLEAVPVLTEFGGHQDPADVAAAVSLSTSRLLSWAYWQYKPWEPRPEGWLYHEGRTSERLPPLVQPYPQAIAGVPQHCTYDRERRTLRLVYRPTAESDGPTVVVAPERVYGDGYAVSVTNGTVVGQSGGYVRVENGTDTATVGIELRPA